MESLRDRLSALFWLVTGIVIVAVAVAWSMDRIFPDPPISVLSEKSVEAICGKSVRHCLTDGVYFLSCQQALENCALARGLK